MSTDTEHQILETIQMIAEDNLDTRIVTMGLFLLDYANSDVARACTCIKKRIVGAATRLVVVANEVVAELGVPVTNKRISMTPTSLVAAAYRTNNPLSFAQALDRAGQAVGVDFMGGYSTLVEAETARSNQASIDSIPETLTSTDIVCSSMSIGLTRAGVSTSAVTRVGEIVRTATGATTAASGLGAAKLVVFANAVGGSPLVTGAFHGVGQPGTVVPIGVSGPGVVERALREVRGMTFEQYARTIKRPAFKITRMGQPMGHTVAERLGVPFGMVDLSLAPTAEIGDSVVAILEELGVESVGAPGTTAALSLLSDVVRKGGLMACSLAEGLSGPSISVLEDISMIHGVQHESISLSKLKAMIAVCSVGLDMVAIPGDTPAALTAGPIADETVIGISAGKTIAVWIIPVPGKGVGESVNSGGLLGWVPILTVSPFSSEASVARGGRVPVPTHSFRN